MSLLDKFASHRAIREQLSSASVNPVGLPFDRVISPTRGVIDGREVVLAGTNNYLGLTFDAACVNAAQDAIRELGTGTTGSRLANGTYGDHVGLEQDLAAFYGVDNAIVFTTGYQANLGLISTLAGKGDVLLLDADSHASIYDGAKLGDAEIYRFKHNDALDIDKRLRRLGDRARNTLVVTEGIYSMLGDRAPIRDIVDVCQAHGAWLLVDEAHALGVLGDTGRGLCEEAGVEDQVDFITGTFSKSLGAVGGYCVSRHEDLEWVRSAMSAYMFTASATPATIATVRAALRRVADAPELRERLRDNWERLYKSLSAMGLRVGPEPGPVVAVAFDDAETVLAAWQHLFESGVYVNLVVPPGASRCLLRCSLSAAHTDADIEQLTGAYRDMAAHMQLLEHNA